MNIFKELQKVNQRPKLFEPCTTKELWTDPHIGKRMFELNFDPSFGLAFGIGSKVKAVQWMIKHFKIKKTTTVLHLGCGPGFYTTPFAERGANVTGIDFSTFPIEHAQDLAKQKALNIRYICDDYLQFTTEEKYDLILLTGRNLSALTPKQRKSLLDKLHDLLTDDGLIFLDVYTYFRFNAIIEKRSCEHNEDAVPLAMPEKFSFQPQNLSYEYSAGNGFWSPDPYYVFMDTFKYDNGKEKIFVDKYSIFEEKRSRVIAPWLQCYDLPYLTEVLKNHKLQTVEYYSNKEGEPYKENHNILAITAKKVMSPRS